jgi:hypothetical protein
MRLDLSRIHWPQVVVLVALIAGVVIVLLFAPPEVLAKLPWPVLAGGAGTAGAGVLASFLGSILKPADAAGSQVPPVPTTPADEAKRRHVATLHGDVPTTVPRESPAALPDTLDQRDLIVEDVDQEAPTKPGGGT